MIRLTALQSVPDFAKGLVRDFRVRWALEEAGLPYEVKLLSAKDKESSSYRRQQPFGQVPVLEDGDLTLFESGSIVLHVAEKSPTLFPADARGRERARTWVFAALNTIEPHLQQLATVDFFYAKEPWADLRRPSVTETIRKRFGELSAWLERREYLEDRFTVGDLMMTSVLRIARHTKLVEEFPALDAYKRRCEARPAFEKAVSQQIADFV